MKRYLLSSGDGTLLEEPLQDELWELDANQSWIILSTLSEFESNGVIHPCKKDLLHSLNYEKYCKVEFYNICKGKTDTGRCVSRLFYKEIGQNERLR